MTIPYYGERRTATRRTPAYLWRCLVSTATLSALCGAQPGLAEIVDHGTQRHGMHSCPPGQFVTGVHVDANLLLCSSRFGTYSPSQEIVDRGTQFWSMHACPDGMAMTGLHADNNLLACAPSQFLARFKDTGTQRSGMHACPPGNPVSGIHVDNNFLLCGTSARWERIGGPAKAVYAGVGAVYATNPQTGDVYRYNWSESARSGPMVSRSGDMVTSGEWEKVGGPGRMFAEGEFRRLYGLSTDGRGVWELAGSTQHWIKIGGPAEAIYVGGSSVFATNPNTGEIFRYKGQGQWAKASGPGKSFAVSSNGILYRISPDGKSVWRLVSESGSWTQIGGPAGALYAGPGTVLYATNPQSGDLYRNLGDGQWQRIGGPGKTFVAGTFPRVYGLSPKEDGVYGFAGKPGEWFRIGGPVGGIYGGEDVRWTNEFRPIATIPHLYATNPETGEVWAYHEPPPPPPPPPSGPDFVPKILSFGSTVLNADYAHLAWQLHCDASCRLKLDHLWYTAPHTNDQCTSGGGGRDVPRDRDPFGRDGVYTLTVECGKNKETKQTTVTAWKANWTQCPGWKMYYFKLTNTASTILPCYVQSVGACSAQDAETLLKPENYTATEITQAQYNDPAICPK